MGPDGLGFGELVLRDWSWETDLGLVLGPGYWFGLGLDLGLGCWSWSLSWGTGLVFLLVLKDLLFFWNLCREWPWSCTFLVLRDLFLFCNLGKECFLGGSSVLVFVGSCESFILGLEKLVLV